MMNCKEIKRNDEKILEITNGKYIIEVPLDYGIRIRTFKRVDGTNMLSNDVEIEQTVGDEKWRIRGGHRIWHTPEKFPRTYQPDNNPVKYTVRDNEVSILQRTNDLTFLQKELVISFNNNEVVLNHKLYNNGMWPIETAVWALTIMAKGGEAIVPLSKIKKEFLPSHFVALWPYSSFNDQRLVFKDEYYIVKHLESIKKPFKIGSYNTEGEAKYILDKEIFTKKFNFELDGRYPDNNCTCEVYTNDKILELETLSPIRRILPNEKIEHIEKWKIELDYSKKK